MAVMRTVGHGRTPARHARVREEAAEYIVELDVADFIEPELKVVALGPVITVRGEQHETPGDVGRARSGCASGLRRHSASRRCDGRRCQRVLPPRRSGDPCAAEAARDQRRADRTAV